MIIPVRIPKKLGNGGISVSYPGQGHGEGHFYHRQPVARAGAAQGRLTGQRGSAWWG